jgi:PAS domain-containing protein
MKPNATEADDLLTTFVQQRQVLLKHTADVLGTDDDPVRQQSTAREARLSAILVTSLEELKVAEEELVERAQTLARLRGDLEQSVRGARQLFELAPACLLVTDVYGGIIDANRASVRLLKRELEFIERVSLANFIRLEERRAFREGLGRLAESDGVTDWRFVLVRPTDGPLNVSAAVRVVRSDATATRLFWSIRVLEPSASPSAIT